MLVQIALIEFGFDEGAFDGDGGLGLEALLA